MDTDGKGESGRSRSDTGGADAFRVIRLRHSYARHLVVNGILINYLFRWLGHSSIQTTLIYLELVPDPNREALHRFRSRLNLGIQSGPSYIVYSRGFANGLWQQEVVAGLRLRPRQMTASIFRHLAYHTRGYAINGVLCNLP